MDAAPTFTAFSGTRRLGSGPLHDVAIKAKDALAVDPKAAILIFNDRTSELTEVDLRGTRNDVRKRLAVSHPVPPAVPAAAPSEPAEEAPRGPGRPKLGVIAREVTLLPRHWDWLATQRGGASVTLRRLVDEARRANEGKDRVRKGQEACYRFMSAMGGNLPGFEEATRALFAGDAEKLHGLLRAWPTDIADHVKVLAQAAMPSSSHNEDPLP